MKGEASSVRYMKWLYKIFLKKETNAGTIDRIVRVVIGIILLYVVAANKVQGITMYVAWDTGSDDAGYAALAYYPLYPVLKINTTCKPKLI